MKDYGEFIGEIKSEKKRFYIGDVCYVLDEKDYQKIWGDKYEFTDGVISFPEGDFVVHGTAYGDGCYDGTFDDRGRIYRVNFPVDAGVIGVVPDELVKTDGEGLIVDAKSAELYYNKGTFIIILDGNANRVIEIETGVEDADTEEDYATFDEEEE